MNRRKLYAKIARNPHNVRFGDLVRLAEAFGFIHERTSGSHHVYDHPGIARTLNLQDHRGEAKPYQVRQFLRMVERYNLEMESGDDA